MLLLITGPTRDPGNSLRGSLTLIPEAPPVYEWELPRRTQAQEPLLLAHLRFLLQHADCVLLEVLPPAELLALLLEAGVPCLARDQAAYREPLGPGARYLPEWTAAEVLPAVTRLRQDPTEAEALTRKARAQARRLRRQLPAAEAGEPDAPAAEPCGARRLGASESGWFPALPPDGDGRRRNRKRVLVLVLAHDEAGLAETFDFLDAAAATVPLHRVLVLPADAPDLEEALRARWGAQAEVVRASTAGMHAAVQAGLQRRHPADGAVLWLESGTVLNDPAALGRWHARLRQPGLACIAPGGVISRDPEVDRSEPGSPELDACGRPGVLWDLRWLDTLGGLHPALPPGAAQQDLGYRLRRAGVTVAVDEPTRLQRAVMRGVRSPEQPLRCGVWTPALQVGGAEHWIVSLLDHTDDRIEWQGVGLTDPPRLDPGMAAEVERTCPVYVGEAAAAELARECEVLVIWGLPGWWTLLPANFTGRVVLVAHGIDLWTAEVFRGSERADGLVLVSEVARGSLARSERARAQVIHNAVTPARVAPQRSRAAVRAGWGVAQDARVLGFLGRFSGEKDPLALARAVRYLPPEWVGVMIGWGDQAEELQLQANALAPGRLRWPGPTADVGSALAAVDTLLVSSSVEGFCYVLAEAWLAGVPTVSTRVGIACEGPELIREVPIEAHGATLAAAVLHDEADPAGTAARVARAQAFTREELSPERFGRRWTGSLLSVAGANPWGRNDRLPPIQVVITGHNVEPWLQRCLDSVEEALQGCRWLLCLADDGSTDRTWEIIQAHISHAEHVQRKRFRKARNAGQAKNRALQLGLPFREQYPALLFMDADDVMPRTRVTYLLQAAVEGAHRLAHGALRFNAAVPGSDTVQGVPEGYIMPAEPDQHHRLCICPPAMVLHESLVPPDGRLFCEDLDAMEDGELLCRWELAGIQSAPLNGPVVHEYWPRAGSVMWNERLAENQRRFWQRVGELRSGKRPLHLEYLTRTSRAGG